jgi:hypothetical protein
MTDRRPYIKKQNIFAILDAKTSKFYTYIHIYTERDRSVDKLRGINIYVFMCASFVRLHCSVTHKAGHASTGHG